MIDYERIAQYGRTCGRSCRVEIRLHWKNACDDRLSPMFMIKLRRVFSLISTGVGEKKTSTSETYCDRNFSRCTKFETMDKECDGKQCVQHHSVLPHGISKSMTT